MEWALWEYALINSHGSRIAPAWYGTACGTVTASMVRKPLVIRICMGIGIKTVDTDRLLQGRSMPRFWSPEGWGGPTPYANQEGRDHLIQSFVALRSP